MCQRQFTQFVVKISLLDRPLLESWTRLSKMLKNNGPGSTPLGPGNTRSSELPIFWSLSISKAALLNTTVWSRLAFMRSFGTRQRPLSKSTSFQAMPFLPLRFSPMISPVLAQVRIKNLSGSTRGYARCVWVSLRPIPTPSSTVKVDLLCDLRGLSWLTDLSR